MNEYLMVALEAADAAETVIKKYWQGNFEVQIKEDMTPVTVADIETEKVIKEVILGAFPEHGFFGEETGKSDSDSEYMWLVDPIDGTKSFVRQYPFFSTQIALMKGDELIVGVSNAPEFCGGERAYASKGDGAFMNGQPIQVSDISELNLATLSLGNIATVAGSPQWQNVGELVQAVSRVRGYGDFYHYHLLASGKAEIIFESDLNILDIAALTVIIREAGGIVTQLDGGEVQLSTRDLLVTTPAVNDQVLDIINR